jgi:hypothetical protein
MNETPLLKRERVLDTIASLPAGDTRSNVGLGYVDADGAAGRTSARGRQLGGGDDWAVGTTKGVEGEEEPGTVQLPGVSLPEPPSTWGALRTKKNVG